MLWKKKVSGEYFSWESFFAAVLIEETKDSYMAYTKRKINPAYLDKTMSGAILKQMGKIKREEMINDRKFSCISQDPVFYVVILLKSFYQRI